MNSAALVRVMRFMESANVLCTSLHLLVVMVGSLLHSLGPEDTSRLGSQSLAELLLYAYKYINVL